MTRPHVPQEILDAAHARKAARIARRWAEADRLKAIIEAAGWRVVDRGADFVLHPSHPPDVVEGGRVRYGASETVPSRLDEPARLPATIVMVISDRPELAEAAATAVRQSPPGTQLVVVADAPSSAVEAALESLQAATPGSSFEIVWTSTRLGGGGALNAGIRRAAGSIVIVLDPAWEVTGDIVTPLRSALDAPGVALAGAGGLAGDDIRDLEPAPAGSVSAFDGSCVAVRRSDAAAQPLDEGFHGRGAAAAAWSLAIRDGEAGDRPRRAVALEGLPIVRRGAPDDGLPPGLDPAGRDRLVRRDRYRLLDRFRSRPDLLAIGPSG